MSNLQLDQRLQEIEHEKRVIALRIENLKNGMDDLRGLVTQSQRYLSLNDFVYVDWNFRKLQSERNAETSPNALILDRKGTCEAF